MAQMLLHLFDTPLGRCGIAWGERGIVSASFPEANDGLTIERLQRRAANGVLTKTVPDFVRSAEERIINLMSGVKDALLDIELDYDGIGEFERGVYALSRAIYPGETRTYGDLAKDLGDIHFSQRVGQALGNNPFPIIVPCHRIVGANGKMTGFSAPGGIETKRKLLKIEGAIDRDLLDLL